MKAPRILVVSSQSSSLIVALLSRAGLNYSPPLDVVSVREGETIELHPGDVYIVDTARPTVTTEQLNVLTIDRSFALERQLPPKPVDCRQGTAFYCNLPRYRRKKH